MQVKNYSPPCWPSFRILKEELAKLSKEFHDSLTKGQESTAKQMDDEMEALKKGIDYQNRIVEQLNSTANSLTVAWDEQLLGENLQLAQRLGAVETSIAELEAKANVPADESTAVSLSKEDALQMLKAAAEERADIIAV